MARAIVGNPFLDQIPTVSATAAPVETFKKAVLTKGPFEALSETLTRINAKADPVLQRMQGRKNEQEFQQGIQLYNENRKSIGEAVKSGLIEEGASPYLRKGYRVSQMNTLAMRYTSELGTALERQKLYTNNNPERIESFIEKFQDNFVEANGMSEFSKSEVAEYFGTPANKGNELFRASWQEKHVAWQQEQNYIQFEAEVAETTINLFRPGMSDDERVIAMGSFAKWLENRSESAAIDGMKNSEVLKTILQGVGLAVEQTGDTDILEVFKMTKFGSGAAAKSLSVQAKILDIEARALILETRRAKQQDDQYKALTQTARTNARSSTNQFFDSPTVDNREILEGQISTLLTFSDDESNILALTLAQNLEAYDTASRLGGQNKDSASELMLDADLRNAEFYTDASRIIKNYANAGKINANDVSTKLNLWRSQYDPANDTPFGLDFFSASTPEGRGFADVFSTVKGDPEQWEENKHRNAVSAKNIYRMRMRDAVSQYMTTTGRKSVSTEQMEVISANVLTNVFAELEAMGFLAPYATD
tara:strand:- start:1656 stop:3263 length:1608 start_codon:yes stop_codon:yes gene_type:complete